MAKSALVNLKWNSVHPNAPLVSKSDDDEEEDVGDSGSLG